MSDPRIAKVLEALGAQREYICWADWSCVREAEKEGLGPHSECGWVWVVDDE